MDNTSSENTYQTGVTYNNYAFLCISGYGITLCNATSDTFIEWFLKRDGTFTIKKANNSYGGTNKLYVTVIHD